MEQVYYDGPNSVKKLTYSKQGLLHKLVSLSDVRCPPVMDRDCVEQWIFDNFEAIRNIMDSKQIG
jgi:hypothetical protein